MVIVNVQLSTLYAMQAVQDALLYSYQVCLDPPGEVLGGEDQIPAKVLISGILGEMTTIRYTHVKIEGYHLDL